VIRKVNTAGIISTIAGNGIQGYSGDGSSATLAQLNFPFGLVFDGAGNLYIGDALNNRIRKVNTSGIISTIVGNGTAGYSGNGGVATAAELHEPYCITFDAIGNLYIADDANSSIRKVSNIAANNISHVTDIRYQILVFPNPAKDVINVEMKGDNEKVQELEEITIYNVSGEAIIQNLKFNAQNQVQVDINKLPSGVYTLQIQNSYIKIIKQ
jgi:hypothetical protein